MTAARKASNQTETGPSLDESSFDLFAEYSLHPITSDQTVAQPDAEGSSTSAKVHEPTIQDEEQANAFYDAVVEYVMTEEKRNTSERVGNFNVLKRWEGFVTSVTETGMTAEVVDMDSDGQIREEIEVDFEEISPEDIVLVEVGAVFYWHVGYQQEIAGQLSRSSRFRFRRLPAWSRTEIAAAKSFAQKIKGALFGS